MRSSSDRQRKGSPVSGGPFPWVKQSCIEAVIAAVQDDKAAMTGEGADLLFHLMVLLADMDLSLDDVIAELARREGLSGLDEKAARGAS